MKMIQCGLPRRRFLQFVATQLNRMPSSSAVVLTVAIITLSANPAPAQNAFVQSNLVSDVPGTAALTDSNLVNPWGISFSASGPFWVADNRTGLSTVYNSSGAVQSLVVTIPPPAGQSGPAAPTGIIANSVAGFLGSGAATAHFLFSTEDGTISAWSGGSAAVLKVDYSASYAVFKGLAAGVSGGSNYIYAPDFYNAQVDVFNTNYTQVTLAGSFSDPTIPAGFAPFGIQNINGQLFVTYALQGSNKRYDVHGPGNGYVDIFDTSGNLVQRLIAQSVLNSPWGVALAPLGFGAYAGDLLVGNFGDGRINVFNPTTGAWLGGLMNTNGGPIEVPGLWAVAFGNGHSGGNAQTLYFTAGINGQSDGLFGSIAAAAPTLTSITNSGSNITLSWAGGGAGPFLVQESTNLSSTNWVTVTKTTNLSATIAVTNQAGFFRLLDQGN